MTILSSEYQSPPVPGEACRVTITDLATGHVEESFKLGPDTTHDELGELLDGLTKLIQERTALPVHVISYRRELS